ncbi:MAG: hypothetical protein Q7T33_09160 [Dehalococcoidia bacterium]|nr:hypothetical protein [Dehalococcoidia bacterium]
MIILHCCGHKEERLLAGSDPLQRLEEASVLASHLCGDCRQERELRQQRVEPTQSPEVAWGACELPCQSLAALAAARLERRAW